MKYRSLALALAAILALAGPAAADDAGNFVIRLGRDTVSVEHYTRTPSRLVVDQVGRSPRVLRRHFVYDYTNGALSHLSVVVTPPGAAPIQTVEAAVSADSLFMHIQNGAAPVQNVSVAMPPGTLVLSLSSQWPGYEGRIMKLV